MKTVVIEGKDLLFTLFKLAFYIWIEMWNPCMLPDLQWMDSMQCLSQE